MRELLLTAVPGLVSIFITAGSGRLQTGDLNPGRGSTSVSVKDFGAKGDLRTCTDVQITKGSMTLFSPAQCKFSGSDVNKWVQVPLAGDIFGTGLSAQIVSVQDSQHATLSVAAGVTVATAIVNYTDLVISNYSLGAGAGQVSSILNPFTPSQVGSTLTITGGTGFTPKTTTILSVSYAGVATLGDIVGAPGSTGGTGTSPLKATIATGNDAAIRAAATYMCSHPGLLVFPPGTYYLEKYKIVLGPNANGVTDILWTSCHDVTVLGYQATISSNGSFRRAPDSGATSYENSVSPFRLADVVNFKIEGLHLNGNVDKMTKAGVAEGQDYGIMSGGSRNLTIRDVNTHNFATDGIIIGLLQSPAYAADQNTLLDNVWSHNNGRMGLTLGNVNGFLALNFQCSQIAEPYTGKYGGHAPRDCVDIEPATGADVPTGNIVFSGGYQAASAGNMFAVTSGGSLDVTIDNVVFDCSMSNSCRGGSIGLFNAKRTLVKNSTFYYGPFACFHRFDVGLERVDIVNDRLVLNALNQLPCNSNDGIRRPIHFVGNHVVVTGTAGSVNGALQLDNMQEVRGNDFFVSKNAKFPGTVNVISYKNTETVADNIYKTDLTNATDPYAVDYTGVGYWRNEQSLNPIYFVVAPSGDRIDGGMQLAGTTHQPTCDAAHRGTFWYLAGSTGVKDTVNVCVKDAGDSYVWRVIY